MKMEHKTFPSLWKNVIDDDLGIVEHIVTVFGIVDLGGDISHKGSFTKTLQEREKNVRVLDSHNTNSIMSAVGVPLEIREVGRDELPKAILDKFPQATGGVKARTQYLMDTPEGRGAFARIKAGAINEYSYGYDALDADFSEVPTKDGKRKVRNLRTIRLWEYSPVLWGMNPATMTTDVKRMSEQKPWDVFKNGAGEFCVYKIDEDGAKVGESLGCHATEDEANDQVAALYASEKEKGAHVVDCGCSECSTQKAEQKETDTGGEEGGKEEKELIDGAPHMRLGDYLQGRIHGLYSSTVDHLYSSGFMSKDERIQMSAAISSGLNALESAMPVSMAMLDLTEIFGPDAMYYMGAEGPDSTKIGRAISGANGEQIRGALLSLAEVLRRAGIAVTLIEEEEAGEEEAEKTIIVDEDAPNMADSEPDREKESPGKAESSDTIGAEDITPINKGLLLGLIELELSDLSIMEMIT